MRTAVIVFIAVGVWLPGLAHAQDSVCDAEPRYLVVTVVGSDAVREGERDEFFTDADVGAYMLDRCRTSQSQPFLTFPASERPDLADEAQASFMINWDADSFIRYYVRESLHEICAVLADCADATK